MLVWWVRVFDSPHSVVGCSVGRFVLKSQRFLGGLERGGIKLFDRLHGSDCLVFALCPWIVFRID